MKDNYLPEVKAFINSDANIKNWVERGHTTFFNNLCEDCTVEDINEAIQTIRQQSFFQPEDPCFYTPLNYKGEEFEKILFSARKTKIAEAAAGAATKAGGGGAGEAPAAGGARAAEGGSSASANEGRSPPASTQSKKPSLF
jgi:hypothetical protein